MFVHNLKFQQSTKSPIGFHQNHSALPSTSTLARLLTAPERTFQGIQTPKPTNQQQPTRQSSTSGKVHNNGEITITPIGLNNARNKDFSMVWTYRFRQSIDFTVNYCRTTKTILWNRLWWLMKLKTLMAVIVAIWSLCRIFCAKVARKTKHFSCVLDARGNGIAAKSAR